MMARLLRVLIVAHSPDDAERLVSELRRNGYQPVFEHVQTSAAFKTAFDRHTWDVVIAEATLLPVSAPALSTLSQERGLDIPLIIISNAEVPEASPGPGQTDLAEYLGKQGIDSLGAAIERQLEEVEKRAARRQNAALVQAAQERLAQLSNLLEQRDRELAWLGELSSQIQACLTTQEAYPIIAEYTRSLFPAQAGGLYMLNPSQNLVEAVAVWSESDTAIGDLAFAPDKCWALRRGRTHVVEGIKNEPVCQHVKDADPRPAAYLCLPLMERTGAWGLLHLQQSRSATPGAATEPRLDSEQPQDFNLRLALTAAETIALALSNIKLRETVREQSIRDPLTGLFNQQYMEESLERELRRATRNNFPISVLMFDLDYFKRFNEVFSHEAGDAYLRALASFLQTHIRQEDIACRYRDDQFALILPDTSFKVAQQRAKQLQEDIKQLKVQYHGLSLSPVTISPGVATFPEHGLTAKAILQAAVSHILRPAAPPPQLTIGPLTLNCHTFDVLVNSKTVTLTPVEFELLYFLMKHAGQVFTTEQLLQEVWQYPSGVGSPELVRVHIKNLRGKIEPDPRNPTYLRTIGRFGYTIRIEDSFSQN